MLRSLLILPLALVCLAAPAWAQTDSNEDVAAKLLTTTVTVRSQVVKDEAGKNEVAKSGGGTYGGARAQAAKPGLVVLNNAQLANDASDLAEGVTVCSGVSLGSGLIVTFSHPAAKDDPQAVRYRITLPDGDQTKALPRVIDHFSSLTLLEISERSLPALEPNETSPRVGATLCTAAASGIEPPLVSIGIVSGVDRSLGGSDLPPLLQCDVLTTETSTGAAIVDRSGKLVGVIVAVPQVGQRGGWVYAAPAPHVRRLLDARVAGKLVVLQRRRATVGLTLGPGEKEGTVVVERIEPGGPAEKTGIRKGDLVLEAQGRKIRSAYQCVDLILGRQPGEKVNFVVQQGDQRRSLDVTLGGGPVATQQLGGYETQDAYVGPRVNVRVKGDNQIEVRGRSNVAELGVDPASGNVSRRVAEDEVGMLKAQLAAFEKVILSLQAELRKREALHTKTGETIESLQNEVAELREQQAAQRRAPVQPAGPQAQPAAPAKPRQP